MPFNWKPSPQLPQPVPPIVIPSTAVTYKVDQVANTVNWGGTLLYNTAPAVYDVVYPSNTSYMINTSFTSLINTALNGYATMAYVNASIANVNVGGGMDWSLINAKGDLIAGLADDTPGIRTIGLNRAVLTANSAYNTGMYWNASKAIVPYTSVNTAVNTWEMSNTDIELTGWSSEGGLAWSPELGRFVFISWALGGTGSSLWTSEDGLEWTRHFVAALDAENWSGLTWSPEKRMFVGLTGDYGFGNTKVATSSDGLNWTVTDIGPGANNAWVTVIWTKELNQFLAVARHTYAITPNTHQVMTSPDGLNWTMRSTPKVAEWFDVVYAQDLSIYCAVAGNNSFPSPITAGNRVMTSSNGVSWDLQTTPTNLDDLFSVAWAPELGILCAVGAYTNGVAAIITSNNGNTWIEQVTSIPHSDPVSLFDIKWAPELGLFVAVGAYGTGSHAISSPDGINWARHETPYSTYYGEYYHFEDLEWAPELGRFVVIPTYSDDYYFQTFSTSLVGPWLTWEKAKIDSYARRKANGAAQNAFVTINVAGQSDVVADSNVDTLTLVAGSGMTITTNAITDTITFSSTGGGGSSGNSFVTINVAGQSDVVADSNNDTLYLTPGNGIGITTNSVTDTITIFAATNNTAPINYDALTATISHADSGVTATTYGNATHVATVTVDAKGHVTAVSNTLISVGAGSNSFGVINVAGQSDVVSDQANDQLTLVAGYGVTITTDAPTDTITFTATDQFARDQANGAFNKANAAVANSGVGANGQLLIGNTVSGGFDLRTLTQGAGTLITNGQGSVTIAANVTSVAGMTGAVTLVTDNVPETTTNLYFTAARVRANISNTAPINYNSTTGVISHADSGVTATTYGNATFVSQVTVDARGHITSASNVAIDQSLAQSARDHANGAFNKANAATPNVSTTNGQLMIGNTVSGGFDLNTLTQGTGIVITNGKGTIEIAATGGSVIDQFARDTANGAYAHANGAFDKANAAVANSGVGANGQLLIGNTVSGGYDINTLTAGPNIIITNDKGSITIEASSGAATDQFARDRANGAYTHANSAYDKANGAIYTAAQIRANISNTAPINYDSSTGIISHAASGVVASGYGSSTQVPVFVVDANGHITSVSNVSISGGVANANTAAAGSIQFNNAGVLGGSANLIWDNANNRVGIGTGTPETDLHIVNRGGTTGFVGFALEHYSGGAGTPADVEFYGKAARGTLASPLPVQQDDILFVFGGSAWNGSAFTINKVWAAFYAAQTWTAANNGTWMEFTTTANNSNVPVERMRITDGGNVGVGNTTPGHRLTVTGNTWLNGPLHANNIPGNRGSILASNGTNIYWASPTANGQLPIGNTVSGGFDISTLTQGAGVLITNGQGTITVAANVTSVAGKVGAVSLVTDDVPETTTNLYFTAARVRANISNTAPINYNSTTGVISHADSGVGASGYGSSTQVPVFVVNATGHVTGVTNTTIRTSKSLAVFTPNTSDNITCFFTSIAVTFTQCISVVQGTNPNVTYRLTYANTRATGTTGTAITGDIVCANSTNGVFTTSFSNATVPANNYVVLQFPSIANTVTEFALTMEF